jgi:flagellar motor switch protein FliN
MPSHDPLDDAARWLADTLLDSLCLSLESMTSERPGAQWGIETGASLDSSFSVGEALWWSQELTTAPGARCVVAAAEAAWMGIGALALRAAGLEDATREDSKGTFLEIVNQALSAMAQAVGRRLKREVSCQNGKESPGPPEGHLRLGITLAFVDLTVPTLYLYASPALLESLQEPSARKESAEPTAAPSRSGGGRTISPAVENSKTLDLLLEVELPVSVSFGRAQLALRDVLKLSSGSIVELNRAISEPVEVIVNNCVIARGEVVVIEGNYGVRINQIISREERLRTLH